MNVKIRTKGNKPKVRKMKKLRLKVKLSCMCVFPYGVVTIVTIIQCQHTYACFPIDMRPELVVCVLVSVCVHLCHLFLIF